VNLTVGIRIYPYTALCDQTLAEGVISPDDNLLWPRFYLSEAVADWVWDYLKDVTSDIPTGFLRPAEVSQQRRLKVRYLESE
jgi:hypothetical protein